MAGTKPETAALRTARRQQPLAWAFLLERARAARISIVAERPSDSGTSKLMAGAELSRGLSWQKSADAERDVVASPAEN